MPAGVPTGVPAGKPAGVDDGGNGSAGVLGLIFAAGAAAAGVVLFARRLSCITPDSTSRPARPGDPNRRHNSRSSAGSSGVLVRWRVVATERGRNRYPPCSPGRGWHCCGPFPLVSGSSLPRSRRHPQRSRRAQAGSDLDPAGGRLGDRPPSLARGCPGSGGHAAPPVSGVLARLRRACADFSARRVKYAFRGCSARRARSAGSRMPSGSTCRSNRSRGGLPGRRGPGGRVASSALAR